MSKSPDRLRLSRRGLIKATGGIAGASALAGPFATLGLHIAEAQNAVTISIWGNHPEWKDPMQEIVDAAAKGTYKAKPVKVLRFEQIPDAHRLVESNGAGGKIVVVV